MVVNNMQTYLVERRSGKQVSKITLVQNKTSDFSQSIIEVSFDDEGKSVRVYDAAGFKTKVTKKNCNDLLKYIYPQVIKLVTDGMDVESADSLDLMATSINITEVINAIAYGGYASGMRVGQVLDDLKIKEGIYDKK